MISDDLFERLPPMLDVFGCSEQYFELRNQNKTSCMISNSIYNIHIRPEGI